MSDLNVQLADLKSRLDQIKTKLDPELRAKQIRELEAKSSHSDFWSDPPAAQADMKRLAALQSESKQISDLETEVHDAVSMTEVLEDKDVQKIAKKIGQLEIRTFLNSPYDSGNAMVSIHAGQGGVEAMDWVAMLLRMYLRFCESRSWQTQVIDETPGEEAGYKTVTFTVNGPYAYGYLVREKGTHRLVRQSPFNADNLRQTSFALVEVLPELEQEDLPHIEIKEEDLDWQFFRASSQGGQNVQKVSTAVRLKHKPTEIVVTAQTERFQEQNRRNALNLLRAKLWLREEAMKEKKVKELKGEYRPASWGNQIRSYVLHPYKMVKDLRTEVEASNPEGELDGNLDPFIEAEIQKL